MQLIVYLKTENTSPSAPVLQLETFYSKSIPKRVDTLLNRLIDTSSLLLQFVAIKNFVVKQHIIDRSTVFPTETDLGLKAGLVAPL